MGELIKVGMADLKVCSYPDRLTTLGLGSCIGACIYDPVVRVIGMVHFMLPDSRQIHSNQNVAKFGDTGILRTVEEMEKLGARRSRMVAKLAGGAQMFHIQPAGGSAAATVKVGDKNIMSARENLALLGIKIVSEDVGGGCGRTIEFLSENGDLKVRRVGQDWYII